MLKPIYTAGNCAVAYQLDWSYTLFWKRPPKNDEWLTELKRLCEPDGIRVLQHEFKPDDISQFLVSTRPNVEPVMIAQRMKGRLQHLVRPELPKAFRRHYSLRSIGSTRRSKLDEYLAGQLQHHPMADMRVTERLARYQIEHADVDLSEQQRTSHAAYWYNLHLVFVNRQREIEIDELALAKRQQTIESVAAKKQHRLSRAAIVQDHLHIALGCNITESPESVALSYMNNLAYACGMQDIFDYSYYVGTFSEYDLGVIPRV